MNSSKKDQIMKVKITERIFERVIKFDHQKPYKRKCLIVIP